MVKQDKKEKSKKKKKDNDGNGVYLVIFGIIFLVALFIALSWLFQSKGTFEYKGLTFNEEKLGEIDLYHHSYFLKARNGNVIEYNLFLRQDPRENNIPLTGRITYKQGKFVYLSINGTGLEQCKQAQLGIANLASFLTNNQIDVKGATQDAVEAELNGLRHITCNSNPDHVVILIQSGEESQVKKLKNNCHLIEIHNCEVLETTEKFILQSILDSK